MTKISHSAKFQNHSVILLTHSTCSKLMLPCAQAVEIRLGRRKMLSKLYRYLSFYWCIGLFSSPAQFLSDSGVQEDNNFGHVIYSRSASQRQQLVSKCIQPAARSGINTQCGHLAMLLQTSGLFSMFHHKRHTQARNVGKQNSLLATTTLL